MRRFWITMPVALAVLALVFGCSGNKTDEASETGQTAAVKTETPATEMAEEPAAGTTGEVEMASVNLHGNLGCGHCSYHLTDSCALAMKADDGTVYLVEATEGHDELMEHRLDEPEVKIAGRVSEVDGQKVIYTDSVEMF